jgi:hypothetical protein
MSTPNVDLLRRTLAHIEANPADWNQATWRCGTGMCFAGWAVTLAGGQWYEDKPTSLYRDELIAEPDDADDFLNRRIGARTIHVDDRAKRVLGLEEGQAEVLFDGGNDLHDLRHIVTSLCEGAGR